MKQRHEFAKVVEASGGSTWLCTCGDEGHPNGRFRTTYGTPARMMAAFAQHARAHGQKVVLADKDHYGNVHKHPTRKGWTWLCSCSRIGATRSKTPELAQAAFDRHVRHAKAAALRTQDDNIQRQLKELI